MHARMRVCIDGMELILILNNNPIFFFACGAHLYNGVFRRKPSTDAISEPKIFWTDPRFGPTPRRTNIL